MATIKPINPLEYITDRDPIPEKVMDSSSWFKTETMELDVGEYVGRPNEAAMFHTSFIMPLLAEGWYIDAVLSRGSSGEWTSTAEAKANSSSSASSSSSAKSESENKATSESVPAGSSFNMDGSLTYYGSKGSSSGTSNGESTSAGTSSNSGSSNTETTQDGGPWWYAYQRLRLKRRKMQSELVLKDMIASFTKAYNEGREINDERYDELVSLYAIMLSRTEEEANAIAIFSADDFKPLAKMVTDAVKAAMEKYAETVDNLPEDWLNSRINDINLKFDNLIAQAKTQMITNGTYNSTVWPTTLSGIEKDRAYALANLKDETVLLKVDAYGKIATMTADIGQKLLDCEIRIIEAQKAMLTGPTEVRNTVFKWMLDFMERREDDYPGLDQIASVASSLGYSEGGAAGAGTVS